MPATGAGVTEGTRIHVLICSTRPHRVGPAIAQWFFGAGQSFGEFDLHLVDLADFALPVFDEPRHPRLQQYENSHTSRWASSVEQADAFVLVTPEYNYGPPPSLLNAMAYLVREWSYKPLAFVSYGGISGGIRGVQMTKQVATTLRMFPILEAVVVPGVQAQINSDGSFSPNEQQKAAVHPLLMELDRLAKALTGLRKQAQ
jgi:NAD(P)H-dependent FMN reductase